ncbi:MAG: hypothetical protein OEM50_08925 [Gammaproteobacteria bacterium]|nr:hypothetical protein [Gammaproteobacteria bacterium]MDH3481825.1 hypothetical protein [Gammaproteobacteria bacterium]
MKVLLTIVVVILGILAFGYWHATTHSTFYVSLNIAGESGNRKPSQPDVAIQFVDPRGSILAKGVRDKQYGFVRLIHPTQGDCHEVEKLAAFSKEARASWQECFEHQSTWIAKWIADVASVSVKYGNCPVRNSPITISRSGSAWYLWWVPHPHIGGKPYSDYSATMTIDKEDCVENRL